MKRFFSCSRKLKRFSFWIIAVSLFLLVLFVNDFTIGSISKFGSRYAKLGEVENKMTDVFHLKRSLEMNFGLSNLGLNMAESSNSNQAKTELSDPGLQSDQALLSRTSENILHYVWCRRGYFEFRHYIALKRAIDVVKPDVVYFHYSYLPEVDGEKYYTWFNQIRNEMFVLHKLSTPCETNGLYRILLVVGLLHRYGGVYVPESSLVTSFPPELMNLDFVSGVSSKNILEFRDGLLMGKRGRFSKPESAGDLISLLEQNDKNYGKINYCYSEEEDVKELEKDSPCINLEVPLNPKDVWFSNSLVAMVARQSMYGVREIRHRHDMANPIPRISHYVCVGNCELKFIGYLSMLSAIHVAKFHTVYIHGPVAPSGVWWEKISRRPQFIYLQRKAPAENGEDVPEDLATSLMKIDVLLKYGGVYQDQNTLWTQKIPDAHFGYETVVSPDWLTHGDWPESINHCVVMAKQNAEYLRQLNVMFRMHREDPVWFADRYLSYKIVEFQPDIAFIDPHLQVKCLNHNCHPTWQEGYRSALLQNRPGKSFFWQNETLSFHWVDNFPELHANMVRYASGTVTDISRFILQRAGIPLDSL